MFAERSAGAQPLRRAQRELLGRQGEARIVCRRYPAPEMVCRQVTREH